MTVRMMLLGAVCAILAVGCGGSGGGGVAEVGGVTDTTAGSFQLRGNMHPPQFTSTTGASVYALTGSIVKAVLNDANPTIDETEILCSVVTNAGNRLVGVSANDGSVRRVIDTLPASKIRCTTSWVYYRSGANLYRVPLAGGSRTLLKNNVLDFDLNSEGTRLIYRLSSPAGYYFANADGSSQTIINGETTQFDLIGGLNSTTCLAVNFADGWLYSINLAGGANFGQVLQLNQPASVAWNAQTGILVHRNNATGDFERYRIASPSVWFADAAYTNPFDWLGPISVGPTGGRIVTSDGLTRTRIDDVSDGTSNTILFEEASIDAVWWGPYIPQRQLIPTSIFNTGGAAIVFSEIGKEVPAVVLADCTTRTSMTATTVSVDGSPNIVYRLDCDQLTKLYYSQGGGFFLKNIVSSPTGLKGAYVSIDAASGEAASVLTFTNRPTESRTPQGVKLAGEGLTFIPLNGKASKKPVTSFEL